jgi:hypothetical protein
MSALGQKRTLGKVRLTSALPPKADIKLAASRSAQQLRQLGDIHRNPPRSSRDANF